MPSDAVTLREGVGVGGGVRDEEKVMLQECVKDVSVESLAVALGVRLLRERLKEFLDTVELMLNVAVLDTDTVGASVTEANVFDAVAMLLTLLPVGECD